VLPGGLIDHSENFEDACLREIYEEIGLKAVSYDSKNALFKLGNESIGSLFYPYYLYESVTKNIQEIDDH
jgi:8-oxo-dGTP pyrophosphatase MutT (NUDIX family)